MKTPNGQARLAAEPAIHRDEPIFRMHGRGKDRADDPDQSEEEG
jgi:hypothetical protein